jgi:hypothetical protein
VDEGSGFANIPNSNPSYQGTDSITLVILNSPLSFDGHRYRCVASNGNCSDTSGIAVITSGRNSLISRPFVSVQPNPARSRTFIKSSEGLVGSSYRLLDLRGVTLVIGILSETSTELDLRSLPSGMYSLKVESPAKGFHSVHKILVE